MRYLTFCILIPAELFYALIALTDSITKAKKYEVAIMYKYLYIREIYTITSMNHFSPRYVIFSQNFNLKIHKQLQKISSISKDIRSKLKDERSDVKSISDTYFISLHSNSELIKSR